MRLDNLLSAVRDSGVVALAAGLMVAFLPMAASAQTLDNIHQNQVVKVGVLLENAPFGFIDTNGTPVGFNVDVAYLIAERLGDDIKVEVVPTTNTSRIANLTTGGIDIAVATISMLPERAEVIQFSKPYSLTENLIVAAKDLEVADFDDLKGKRIGVGQGSSAENQLLKMAPPEVNLQTFADRAASLQALQSGQVDAVADDNMIMLVLKDAAGDQYERKFAFSELWMGVGMPKDQPELHQAVNAAIDEIRENGKLEALHQKWLNSGAPEWPDSVPGVPF